MHSDEEGEDQTITNPVVMEKYKAAAKIVNGALQAVVEKIGDGKTILELCAVGDKYIVDQANTIYKKSAKGIAFPTCISVNNIAGHYSAETGDKTTLKTDDVVKIDLGAHIDGFIVVAAHTTVVGNNNFTAATGKSADAICAAHLAGEAVLRLLKPRNKNTDIAPVVQTVCEAFKVNTLEAVLSHSMSHHVIDGTKVIPNKLVPDQAVEEFEFEEHEVYAIDIVVSTGTGKTREQDLRPTVFKRDVDRTYLLKLQASRKVLSEISRKSPTLPFSIRSIEEKHARFGLGELEKHGLIHPYPILYEKQGELIVQFKYTAYVGPNGGIRLTGLPLPFVKSEFSVEDARVKELINTPIAAKGTQMETESTNKPAQTTTSSDVAPMDL